MSSSLPQGWEEKELSDFLDIKHGYAFKGKYFSDKETKYILLTPGNFKILGGFKSDKFKFYSEEGFIPEEYILEKNDLLVSMTDLSKEGDTLGYPLLVPTLEKKVLLHNQRLGKIQFLNNKIDKSFLFYAFCTSLYRGHVLGSATGTTVRHTAPNRIVNYKLKYPKDTNEQKRIADILSVFDDKIELNNQMNQTLEDMSTALFKEWFENFNFPNNQGKAYKKNGGEMKLSELGEIPIDWEVKYLKEISKTISKGTTPRKKDVDGLETQILFLKVKDINDNGIINLNGLEKIPKEVHLKQLKRSILEIDDILVSIAGTIGRVTITPKELDNANCNQAVAFIRLKDKEEYKKYVYQWIRTSLVQSQINSSIVQGVQANVSLTTLGGLNITMPDEKVMKKYNHIFSPIFEQIQQNQQQNQLLKQQRDTLLPKLMSGEIRV